MEHNKLETVPESGVFQRQESLPSPLTGHALPFPLPTKRERRDSVAERAAQGPVNQGKVKFFCRQRGFGYITPTNGDDDLFVHISDIDGEYCPCEGDDVTFKTCPLPPKFEKLQAVHVTIRNLNPGQRHERWDQPPVPHKHPHPAPNVHEGPHHDPLMGDGHNNHAAKCCAASATAANGKAAP